MKITKTTRLLPPFIGTRFTIELTDKLDFAFWSFGMAESSDTGTINWGDGCVESFGGGDTLRHTYQNAGHYVISISDDITDIAPQDDPTGASKNALVGLMSNAQQLWQISNNAFALCVNLSALDINNSAIETLGRGAFKGCVLLPPRIDLRNVRNLLTREAEYPFNDCSSIREIHFSKANERTIKATAGYNMAFGAPNAEIKFDL